MSDLDRSNFLSSLRTSSSRQGPQTATFGNFAQQQQVPQQMMDVNLLNQMRIQNLKLQEQILLQQFQAQQAFEQMQYQQHQQQQLGMGRPVVGGARERSVTDSGLGIQSPSLYGRGFGQQQEEDMDLQQQLMMLRLADQQQHQQQYPSQVPQTAFVNSRSFSDQQQISSPTSSRLPPFLSTRPGDGGIQAGHILAAHALARKGRQNTMPISSGANDDQFQSFSSFGPLVQQSQKSGGPNNPLRAGHHRRSSSTNSFLSSSGSQTSNGIITPALVLSRPGEEWPTSPVSQPMMERSRSRSQGSRCERKPLPLLWTT
ncbi:hypothetical protein BT69DRAFT_579971 [Atractiella rhizophila]|nr:hypothetical protein BT69DRAFT_579971 [Atractiella rhizophila]